MHITIVAPEYNLDDNLVEYIGSSEENPVRIYTRSFDIDNYKLVETGPDTGIFAGEITLSNGDKEVLEPNNNDDGLLPISNGETGITVSFEFEEDKVAITSVPITWNAETVQ